MTRARLRSVGLDSRALARRIADGRVTPLWTDTFVVGERDIASVPLDVIRRAAVATVEPNAALGGVSSIERLCGWDRFEGEIVVVSDRRHANIPTRRITFRQVDVDRELEGMSIIGGIATAAALPSIVHAARDLTVLQAANAMTSLRYRSGLAFDDVQRELSVRQRIIGAPILRGALEVLDAGSVGTKSRSEDVMFPCVAKRYGEPLVNVRGSAGMTDYEPDMIWVRRGWILEIDGRHHMEDPVVRAADAKRDAQLRAEGWTVVRIPWWWVWRRRAHALRVIEHAFHP